MNTCWNIDTGDGTSLSQGIMTEVTARRAAQSHANRLGQPVYLYEVGGATDEDGDPVTEEVRPE
jgi:hypothetical protein